ncbi:hypothetical protein F4777DRAFT_95552 [Nemania sp. FL0916]|nr:hypothetical protein F4777DRAFT_95552 [Nemania sp. FL0916]
MDAERRRSRTKSLDKAAEATEPQTPTLPPRNQNHAVGTSSSCKGDEGQTKDTDAPRESQILSLLKKKPASRRPSGETSYRSNPPNNKGKGKNNNDSNKGHNSNNNSKGHNDSNEDHGGGGGEQRKSVSGSVRGSVSVDGGSFSLSVADDSTTTNSSSFCSADSVSGDDDDVPRRLSGKVKKVWRSVTATAGQSGRNNNNNNNVDPLELWMVRHSGGTVRESP